MSGNHSKHFVLDTNVLLHNPNALFMFTDNEVVIPFDVIEELDKFKANSDDLGRNARTVIRHLDQLRKLGKLSDGVSVAQTGGGGWGKLGEGQERVPGSTIDELYAKKQLKLETDPALNANEYVLLKDSEEESHTAIARYRGDLEALVPMRTRRGPVFGIAPRNLQQTMALDLLLDDSV